MVSEEAILSAEARSAGFLAKRRRRLLSTSDRNCLNAMSLESSREMAGKGELVWAPMGSTAKTVIKTDKKKQGRIHFVTSPVFPRICFKEMDEKGTVILP
jgi:hypothetical protein